MGVVKENGYDGVVRNSRCVRLGVGSGWHQAHFIFNLPPPPPPPYTHKMHAQSAGTADSYIYVQHAWLRLATLQASQSYWNFEILHGSIGVWEAKFKPCPLCAGQSAGSDGPFCSRK